MSAQLYETPANPMPANAEAGYFVAPDGKRLRYARFAAEGRPLQGTVVIIPGRNECIEKYFETIGDLSRRGFGSAIFDLRGQGGSDRLVANPRRGHVSDFADYVGDVEPFFQDVVLPDCRGPYYLLAHSTGALVALLSASRLVNRVQRMMLLSPLLGLYPEPLSMANAGRLSSFLHAVGLGQVPMASAHTLPFAQNVLTSDPERYTRKLGIYKHYPELGIGAPSASWVRAACNAIARVSDERFMTKMGLPTLIVAAGMDKVVDSRATENYVRRLRVGSLLTIDGARHELLQEADYFREQVLAAFDAFMSASNA